MSPASLFATIRMEARDILRNLGVNSFEDLQNLFFFNTGNTERSILEQIFIEAGLTQKDIEGILNVFDVQFALNAEQRRRDNLSRLPIPESLSFSVLN